MESAIEFYIDVSLDPGLYEKLVDLFPELDFYESFMPPSSKIHCEGPDEDIYQLEAGLEQRGIEAYSTFTNSELD